MEGNLSSYGTSLVLINCAATLFMTGLIWFVQVVHYPLMKHVGLVSYQGYQRAHMARTTWVVMPIMLLEIGTALGLLFVLTEPEHIHLAWRALMLLVVVWASTACLQVPAHRALLTRFENQTHGRLVKSNWVRTIAWSTRSVLMLLLCFSYVGSPSS